MTGIDGLNFPIRVDDQFSPALERFRAEAEAIVTRMVSVRDSIEMSALSVKDYAKSLQRASRQQERMADSAERMANAADREAITIRANAEARRQITKLQFDNAVAQEKERVARAEGISILKQSSDGLSREERALRRLEKALTAKQVAEDVANLAAQRGVDLSTSKLASLSAEAAATRRVAEARKRSEIEQALAARGFDATGRPQVQGPPVPKELQIQQAAELKFERDLQALREKAVVTSPRAESEEYQRLAQQVKGVSSAKKLLQAEMSALDTKANQMLFTFRRLVGIFAAFALVRNTVQGFNAMVDAAIKFNATLESSQLSIASLISSVAKVRSPIGEVVTTAQGLALAQKEAVRQTSLLRAEALRTSATFEELLQAFQSAIAPGVTAGLDIDQIRNFTVAISQAASALKVEQSLLAEEIRSILQGTITPRNTRIATALGITNQDIRTAKEAGKLVEFLTTRFAAFGAASQESLNTFTVILSNTKDALQNLIGTGSLGFFEALKSLLRDIQTSLGTANTATGFFEVNPQALAIVRAIAQGLQDAVAAGRQLVESLTFDQALAIAKALAAVLGGAAQAVSFLIQSLARAGADILLVFQKAAGAAAALGNALGLGQTFTRLKLLLPLVGELVALGLEFALVTKVWNVGMRAVVIAARAISGPLALIPAVMRLIETSSATVALIFRTIFSRAFLIVAALFIVGTAIADILDKVFGINIRFGTIVTMLKTSVVAAVKLVANAIRTAWGGALYLVTSAIDGSVNALKAGIYLIFNLALRIASLVSDTAVEQLKVLQAQRAEQEKLFKERQRQRDLELQALDISSRSAFSGAVEEFKTGIKDAWKNNDTAKTFEQTMAEAGRAAGEFFSKSFGDSSGFTRSIDQATGSAQDLVTSFRNLPGVLDTSRASILSIAEAVKDINDQLRKSTSELRFARANAGVSANVRAQAQELANAQFEASEKSRQIDAEILQSRLQLTQTQRLFNTELQRSNSLTSDEQKLTLGLIQNAKALLEVDAEIARTKDATIVAERLRSDALRRNDREEADRQNDEIRRAKTRLDFLDQLQKKALEAVQLFDPQVFNLSSITPAVRDAAKAILALMGQEVGQQEKLRSLEKARTELQSAFLENARKRIEALALENLAQVQLERRSAQVEALNARAAVAFASTRDSQAQRISEAQAKVREASVELELLRARQTRDQQALRTQLKSVAGKAEEVILSRQLVETEALHNAQLETSVAKLQQAALQAALVRQEVKGTFGEGLSEGIRRFSEEFSSAFAAGIRVAQQVLQETAGFLSQLVVDAFDPTQKVDLRERFGRFFQGLAKMLLEEFIKLQLAKLFASDSTQQSAGALAAASSGLLVASGSLTSSAILWKSTAADLLIAAYALAAAGGAAGAVGGVSAGFSTGGPVNAGRWVPSPQHYSRRARGFAAGGRPRNIARSDTIPAWLGVGEWVMRRRAVQKYGHDFMDMTNRGLLDPSLVKALTGMGRLSASIRPSPQQSFATGGPVQALPRTSSEVSSDRLIVLPTLVTDEASHYRTLASGKAAQLGFMRDHAPEIRNVLGIGRGDIR